MLITNRKRAHFVRMPSVRVYGRRRRPSVLLRRRSGRENGNNNNNNAVRTTCV